MRNQRKRNGPKLVAKIRRSKQQAYGSKNTWLKICARIKQRDGYKCRKCGATRYLHVDHIIPVSRGGLTVASNLWTICDNCHAKRPFHRRAKALILHRRKRDEAKRVTKTR